MVPYLGQHVRPGDAVPIHHDVYQSPEEADLGAATFIEPGQVGQHLPLALYPFTQLFHLVKWLLPTSLRRWRLVSPRTLLARHGRLERGGAAVEERSGQSRTARSEPGTHRRAGPDALAPERT
jgi:hypothetical protein